MKTRTFGEHLCQFSESVDHVEEDTFLRVLNLIATYADQELGLRYFEFMEPHTVNGREGLKSSAIYLNGKRLGKDYSTEMFQRGRGRKPISQAALAYDSNSELWIVSKTKGPLVDSDDVVDQWSQKISLPKYKRAEELESRTSVLVPVDQDRNRLGLIDFEGDVYIPFSATTSNELERIGNCVAKLWFLCRAFETQKSGTEVALDNLNDILARRGFPPFGTPELFLAYPDTAKQDVLRIIHKTLVPFEEEDRIKVVDWKKLKKPGTVMAQLLDQIDRCRFGLCYLSEEISDDPNRFRDNPNVLFEAGMFHALVNLSYGDQRKWIPIREKESLRDIPFDFAAERRIEIQRDEQGEILDEEKVASDLHHTLNALIENA